MNVKSKPRLAVCVTSLGARDVNAKALRSTVAILEAYFDVLVDRRVFEQKSPSTVPPAERIDSINWAAEQGDIVLAWDGGFNSVELLYRFNELKLKPGNLFVGYSDNTILVNALRSTGMCQTTYGPMLEDMIGNPRLAKQAARELRDIVRGPKGEAQIVRSKNVKVLSPGEMKGPIWGGNNYSFDLLQGTRFMPNLQKPYILFMEGEDILKESVYTCADFIRNLDAVCLQKGAQENLQGLILGAFPDTYTLKQEQVVAMVRSRPFLQNIPIVYNYPCGHGSDKRYLPIGALVSIKLDSNNLITISKI